MTIHTFGLGKAIYIGTMSQQGFYYDLGHLAAHDLPAASAAQSARYGGSQPAAKSRDQIYFLLNHQSTPVRITFYKPMHDFLTERTFSGNYDLPPHGILVLDEQLGEMNAPERMPEPEVLAEKK